LAANHRAAVDTAAIALTAGRPVSFLGKAEYFTGCGLRGRALAAFLRALGYVPVDRGNAKAGLAALHAARTVLDAGGAFAIYPEGTRSLDGRLHRGHTGVATLALDTGAVVVPVALVGTERVQPIGKRLPRLHRVTVRYGEPLDFARYEGLGGSTVIRRAYRRGDGRDRRSLAAGVRRPLPRAPGRLITPSGGRGASRPCAGTTPTG